MAIRDFLSNLGEGLSEAAGAPGAAERFSEPRRRRQALSDLELETQTQQILGDVQGLHERRSKLDPNSPTYQQDIQTIDQALHDARQVFTDLYHPAKNPGALSKLHGFIQSHIGRHKGKTAAAPATPAAAKQSINERMAGIEATAYGQSTPENPYTKQRRELKEAMPNISEEDLDKATRIGAKVEAAPRTPTSTWKEYVSPDGKQRQFFDVTDPDNIPEGWQAAPRGAGAAAAKPKKGWSKDAQGNVYSVLLDPTTNQPMPGTENFKDIPASDLGTRLTEGTYHWQDDKGNLHETTEERTSRPVFQQRTTPTQAAPAPSANIPKTPAQAKRAVPPPSRDRILGHKDTTAQSKARVKFTEASGLSKLADEVAKHPDDAINQKRLAVRLERISAGRFTTQALQYIIKAGWGNTIEQWANNVTTGALPPDVLRQIVDGAHQEVTEAREEMRTSGLEIEPTPEEKILQQLNEAFGPKKPEQKK